MMADRDTSELVRQLARDGGPVRRIPAPPIRAVTWLAIALASVAVVVFIISPRPDLAAKLSDWRFVIEQLAALATAVTAAIAAFCLTVPGHSRRFALLPALPLGVWVGTLGLGCIADWMQHGVAGLRLAPDLACFPYIAMVGAVPAIAIVVMLRQGAPLWPYLTLGLAGLAAAALGNFGLRFFHTQDAAIMVLVWQFGSVVLLSALVGMTGRLVLRWRHRAG